MLSSVFGNCQTVLYSWIQGRIKYPFGILNWMPGWLWWHHPPLWWREDGGASHGMSDLNVSYSTCFRPQRKYWPYCKYIYIHISYSTCSRDWYLYIYIFIITSAEEKHDLAGSSPWPPWSSVVPSTATWDVWFWRCSTDVQQISTDCAWYCLICLVFIGITIGIWGC